MFKVEGTEIILSAGSIATPQILMLSGVGSKEFLSTFNISVVSDLPGVGKNLRDHPTVHTTWKPHYSFNKPEQKIGPQKVALRYTSQDSKYQNDMIMIMRFSHEIGDTGALMISVGIYLAESVGRISLQSTDIQTQPILDYNLLSHEHDLKRLREGVRLADKIAKAPSFTSSIVGRLSPDETTINDDDLLDKWMLENVLTMLLVKLGAFAILSASLTPSLNLLRSCSWLNRL
jgi:choline dehydrogenase